MALPLNTSDNPNDPATVARYHMVQQQIRPWNVSDEAVLELLQQVPREDFTPTAYRGMAFMDMEIPLLGQADEALHLGHCMLAPRVEARLQEGRRLLVAQEPEHIPFGIDEIDLPPRALEGIDGDKAVAPRAVFHHHRLPPAPRLHKVRPPLRQC